MSTQTSAAHPTAPTAATPSSARSSSARRAAEPFGRVVRAHLLWMGAVIAGLYVAGLALLATGTASVSAPGAAHVFGWGTGLVAFTLGIRHAFDADHIAAIDNTTRALARENKRPVSVGFFFALGHCSVVLMLTVALMVGAMSVQAQLADSNSSLHHITGMIGPAVSGVFMLVVAVFNGRTLLAGLNNLRQGRPTPAEVAPATGPLARILRPVLDRVTTPASMYPVGFLFGLGFDTATEIGLLVLSATAAVSGLPWWAVLALPLLFAAGMTTFDTADGVLMQVVYGWALTSPRRTLVYNLTLTGISCAMALVVAIIQLASLGENRADALGEASAAITGIDVGWLGYAAAGTALTVLVILVVLRYRRRQPSRGGRLL